MLTRFIQLIIAVLIGVFLLKPIIQAQYRADVEEIIRKTASKKKNPSRGRYTKEELENSLKTVNQMIINSSTKKISEIKLVGVEENSRAANKIIRKYIFKKPDVIEKNIKINSRKRIPPDEISIRNGWAVALITDNASKKNSRKFSAETERILKENPHALKAKNEPQISRPTARSSMGT